MSIFPNAEDLKKNLNSNNSILNNKNNNFENIIKKIYEEPENIYKAIIINLKKETYTIKQENNNLKKIIENLKKLLDELMNKNKLLSSKVIKYKMLYEEKKNKQ